MVTPKKPTDRRVQRTRQLLRQAFFEVVQEKGFAATTVQDITERANLNRGTFYTHFEDKYRFTDMVIRERFLQLLADILPPEPRWDRPTLRLLIQGVLVCFEGKYRHQHYPSHVLVEMGPLLERAIHEELTSLILTWLKQAEGDVMVGSVPPETMASVVSSAIFGAAVQWSREKTAVPLDQMADDILHVIMDGVGWLTLAVLPE